MHQSAQTRTPLVKRQSHQPRFQERPEKDRDEELHVRIAETRKNAQWQATADFLVESFDDLKFHHIARYIKVCTDATAVQYFTGELIKEANYRIFRNAGQFSFETFRSAALCFFTLETIVKATRSEIVRNNIKKALQLFAVSLMEFFDRSQIRSESLRTWINRWERATGKPVTVIQARDMGWQEKNRSGVERNVTFEKDGVTVKLPMLLRRVHSNVPLRRVARA